MKNQIFFDKVSESISKYKTTGLKETPVIRSSTDSFKIFLQEYEEDLYDVEHFYVLFLNRANKPIVIKKISSGGMTGTVVDIRVVLRYGIICKATSMVLCHNHPSGNLKPSQADIDLTKKIKQAGAIMDIQVIDHIVIGDESNYYSFADEGLI